MRITVKVLPGNGQSLITRKGLKLALRYPSPRPLTLLSNTILLGYKNIKYWKWESKNEVRQERPQSRRTAKLDENIMARHKATVSLTLSSQSFWTGLFHLWNWSQRVFQRGVSVTNENQIANRVDPDETSHCELSHQDLQCLQKSYLICRAEG